MEANVKEINGFSKRKVKRGYRLHHIMQLRFGLFAASPAQRRAQCFTGLSAAIPQPMGCAIRSSNAIVLLR